MENELWSTNDGSMKTEWYGFKLIDALILDRDEKGFDGWLDTIVMYPKEYQNMLDELGVKGIDSYKGLRVIASPICPETKIYLTNFKEFEDACMDINFIKPFYLR
jgi:hypothetical protein